MSTIQGNIAKGKYEPKVEHVPKMSTDQRNAYWKSQSEARDLFDADCLAELGLTEHPKAKRFCEIAWQEGHSSGYSEVWNVMLTWEEVMR